MKKTLLSFVFLSITFSLYSQNPKIEWGSINKEIKLLYDQNEKPIYNIIDFDKEHYYITKSNLKNTKVEILKFDNEKHEEVSNTPLDLSYNKKKTTLEQTFEIGEEIFTYQSLVQKGEMSVIFSKIDELQLKESKVVFTHKFKKIAIGSGVGGVGSIKVGNDKKFIGYVNTTRNMDKRGNEEVAVCLFDKDLNKIWGRVIELKYKRSKIHLGDFVMDNQGNIYVLAIKDNKAKDVLGGRWTNFSCVLFKIDKDNIQEIEMKLENGLRLTEGLLKSEAEGIMFGGAYRDKYNNPQEKGVYIIHVSSDGTLTSKTQPFSKAIQEDRKSIAASMPLMHQESISYVPIFFDSFNNGTKAIVLEMRYSHNIPLITGNLIVSTVSENLEISNGVSIKKKLHIVGWGPNFLYPELFIFNDKLHMIYSKFKDENMPFQKQKNITSNMVIFNNEGKILSTNSIHNKEIKNKKSPYLIPTFSYKKDNTIIINSFGRLKNTFGYLKLD